MLIVLHNFFFNDALGIQFNNDYMINLIEWLKVWKNKTVHFQGIPLIRRVGTESDENSSILQRRNPDNPFRWSTDQRISMK